ncbi:MAG: hypothetical protein JXR94_10255, partial [Candidatus Hydrogenedentes bacterium]|nr:hypothetical protein [Candidatus Hydrogenedentota bacterium]
MAERLGNGSVELNLGTTDSGVPCILSAAWKESGRAVFHEADTGRALDAWAPADLVPAGPAGAAWRRVEHPVFERAEAACTLNGGLVMTWVVDLAREGSLFRAHIRLTNDGPAAKAVAWYPVWAAAWDLPGAAHTVRWWKALSFEPQEQALGPGDSVALGSRLHSSDRRESDGVNPYWVVAGDDGARLYCSLDWCGGWQATLTGTGPGLAFAIRLPEHETQLVLEPGESIDGPVLTVTATTEPDERASRATWMRQRAALQRNLYGGPPPSYPFTYNHWYTTRFNVDGDFLARQVAEMDPYGFDFFIIDAGWYEHTGQWTPDPE